MFRVLLTLLLLANGPGQAARGAVPGSPFGPASPQNQAPQTVDYIDVGTIYVGGSSATVNASSYFSDPNGDTLTYSVNNPSPLVVTVSILESTVTIAPVAAGTTGKIIVTARDPGGLTATQDFTATVENPPPVNRAPRAVGSISNVTLQVGGTSATRSVSGKFSDPDGDKLTYTVNSPSPTIATTSISGSTVTIAPVAAGMTGKIIVTARDPGGLTATQDFTATVSNPPPPPPTPNRTPTAVGSISDVSLSKGGSSATRSVSGKFSDPDGDTLTYSASSSRTSVATVSVSGSTVTVRSGVTGTATVTVTATDTDDATATQDFDVRVINRPPGLRKIIPAMTFHRNQAAQSVDLSDHFNDEDNDALTYTASSGDTSVATVSVSGSSISVDPGILGSTRITVTAEDTDNARRTHSFSVAVENRPPRVTRAISAISLNKNRSTSINASSHFSDPDGDTITFSARTSDTGMVSVSVSGNSVTISSKNDGGDATVTVTATDALDDSVSTDFTVTVLNRSPRTRGSISGVSLYKKSHTLDVDVSGKFTDPDGDALTYSATSSNTAVATASVSGGTVTITSGRTGNATITVKAEDIDMASAAQTISVSVTNRSPEIVDSFADVNLKVGGPSKRFDVSGVFSDPDSDTLTFTVDDPDTSVARVSISGSEVTVAPESEGRIGKVTVTATDTEEASISEDFRVVVGPEGSPPPSCPAANTVPVTVPNVYAGGDSVKIDVSAYFTIPEGVTPTYAVNDPNPSVATFSVSGDTLTIQPVTQGYIGNVNVTAKVASCSDVSRAFELTVKPAIGPPPPSCPTANTVPIVVPYVCVGGGPVTMIVSTYFAIPTGVSPTYEANNPDTTKANVSISGDTLTIDPKSHGDTGKIIITASATGCNDLTRDFNVNIAAAPSASECPAVKQAHPSRDVALTVGGSDFEVNLNAHFTNLAGNGIDYAIVSSNSDVATASRTDTTLTISPGISGTAQVTITVSRCGCGTSANQVFNVRVDPQAPPPATTVTVNPTSASIPEGDTQQFTATAKDLNDNEIQGMTFTWASSATTVATINSSGLATAVSADTTTITATTDGVTGTASLIVTEPPTCPMLKYSIAVQTLTLGGSAARIDLTRYFSLPVDFVPNYVVSSTDTNVTTTSLAGAMLTVTPAAAGTDTVSVTVSKQDCDSVKQSFVVTVNLPCPSAIADAPIPDQTLIVGAGTTQIDLTQHFEHIDQDDIEITVTSPSPGIATAAIEGTSLKIDPVAAGQIAAVTVTVSDTAESDPCDPVSLSFMVTVQAAVEHPGLYPWSVSGEDVYRLTGNVGIGVEVPDQKLVVDGTVKAEGYRLRMIPADYVFEAGYDLLSLDEVASYIRKHGHLPGVASGAEMKANGLGISRMQTTLLEKIEELSLYIIAQHEQLRVQGDRLDSQQQKLEIRKKQASELEHRLRRLEE